MTMAQRVAALIGFGPLQGRTIVDVANRIALWHERSRQRRALMKLDDRMLRDIGIARSEAENEARKPFWCP